MEGGKERERRCLVTEEEEEEEKTPGPLFVLSAPSRRQSSKQSGEAGRSARGRGFIFPRESE